MQEKNGLQENKYSANHMYNDFIVKLKNEFMFY